MKVDIFLNKREYNIAQKVYKICELKKDINVHNIE